MTKTVSDDWLYHGVPVKEAPDGMIGFIYNIDLPDGRKYIGKNLFKFKRTKLVKGKKKRLTVDSDWLTYYSSSDELKAIAAISKEGIIRTILHFCKTKSELNYRETQLIFENKCLLDDNYINKWVSCKIHKSTVIGKVNV